MTNHKRSAVAARRSRATTRRAERRFAGPVDLAATSPDARLLRMLSAIVARAPRDYEEPHRRLVDILARAETEAIAGSSAVAGSPLDQFRQGWRSLVEELLLSPSDLAAFFPQQSAAYPELGTLVRDLARPTMDDLARQAIAEARRGWLADQADLGAEGALLPSLLHELATTDFAAGGFAFLGRYYRFKDALYGHLVEPAWRPLHRRIFDLLDLQQANWAGSYVSGYSYQGYARLGMSGVKPTEERLAGWDIYDVLVPGARVLDIGSNSGFLSLEIARAVGHVEAIEYNPYLVLMARAAQDGLGVDNVDFVCGDFTTHEFAGRFDVVLSLANHQTTDKHMTMPFADYVAKLFSILMPGGTLLFESHNVFAPGRGGPGDDGDLNAKFDVAERSFEVIRHKMTRRFVPGDLDVDKLFVVMRRRDQVDESAVRTLDLATARRSYGYRAA